MNRILVSVAVAGLLWTAPAFAQNNQNSKAPAAQSQSTDKKAAAPAAKPDAAAAKEKAQVAAKTHQEFATRDNGAASYLD